MSRKWLPLMLFGAFILMLGPVTAQQRAVISTPADRSGDLVRVQVSINFFVPGPTGESEQAVTARERARRSIYQMAARECELLQGTIANDCRLEAINVNVHRQHGHQPEGFTATGNMTYRILLK